VSENHNLNEKIREFWNSRAGLGVYAGTRDVILKQLEIEAIAAHIYDGKRVLDVGCGNGITAIEMARRYRVDVLGIDFASEMIARARDLANNVELKGSVQFQIGDVRSLPRTLGRFQVIYTERTLINLPDWPTQRQAISDITRLLEVGGLYVMCENSQDGLDAINALRQRIGLPPITPPWHNRYFRDAELMDLAIDDVTLEGVEHYSSTYYFLSRIVNAWLAAQEGKEPDYESPINRLALQLPAIGELSQGRIWLWRKVRERSDGMNPDCPLERERIG